MNLIFFSVLTNAMIYVLIHQIIFRFYLLKYSLFFSSTLVLTSSIDVVFILSIIVRFMSANIRIRFGLQIVLVCLYHHHCANLSEGIEFLKCLSDIFCRVCQ